MSSSLTTPSLAPITSPDPETQELLGLLSGVPDPRDPRGVRYPLAGVLAVAVSAVLTGARSFAGIGEWASELGTDRLDRLGLNTAPEESTLRKLFARLDVVALDRQLGTFAWTRTGRVQGRRVIAIEGKTVRRARVRSGAEHGSVPHLVAALDHLSGVVLGQVSVAAKSNQIPAVRDLLAGFHPC